jgi:hypothetical protein
MERSSGFGEGNRTRNCMYGRDNGEELRIWRGAQDGKLHVWER